MLMTTPTRRQILEQIVKLKYQDQIQKYPQTEGFVFDVLDLSNVKDQFLADPQNWIRSLKEVVWQQINAIYPDYCTQYLVHQEMVSIRLVNVKQLVGGVTKLKDLNSKHIGKLVVLRGMVNRLSPIRPFYIVVTFICRECGSEIIIPQELPIELITPTRCSNSPSCRCHKFDASNELSHFVDSQELRLQELPEDTKGRIPRSIDLFVFSKPLLNKIKCGDIAEITGIVKLFHIYKRGRKTRFTKFYLEVFDIQKRSKDVEEIQITPEEEAKIRELAQDPAIIPKLAKSIAPSIYGWHHIKESCVYFLFGGVRKERADITIRGDINILLAGDPSTAKSQLLRAISNVAPRAIYTSGKGSTAAGLTAAVVRDSLSGEPILEAGALVLADGGICCVDELDKMRPEDRTAIHEAMEQQTISIAKFGIVTTLYARCGILAAANPLKGRWDDSKTVSENLANLPVSILSRFDLIWIMKDVPEEETDLQMALHILGEEEELETIPIDLIKKYIAYARQINPKLTPEAKKIIAEFYTFTRKKNHEEQTIMITARQLEGLIRLAEAHARIRLSDKVEAEDAEAAIELFKKFLQNVDIEDIETEGRKTIKDEIELVYRLIKENDNFGVGVERDWIIKLAKQKGVRDPAKIIAQLNQNGKIYEPREGWLKAVR